jgi:hypothetical protein
LHEKRIEPELSPEREAKLGTRGAQETGTGAAKAKPRLRSSNRARTQKGAEAKNETSWREASKHLPPIEKAHR